MGSHIDNIVHFHTDDFIATKKLDTKLGTNLGDLKYEGCCENVKVYNSIFVRSPNDKKEKCIFQSQ